MWISGQRKCFQSHSIENMNTRVIIRVTALTTTADETTRFKLVSIYPHDDELKPPGYRECIPIVSRSRNAVYGVLVYTNRSTKGISGEVSRSENRTQCFVEEIPSRLSRSDRSHSPGDLSGFFGVLGVIWSNSMFHLQEEANLLSTGVCMQWVVMFNGVCK